MKSLTLLILTSLLTISCASVGRLNLDVAPPSQSKSIFVIGINSSRLLKINVFPGKLVDGKFQKSQFRPAAIAATPTDGYIVGECKGGDLLAITEIAIVKDANTIVGDQFASHDEGKTLVFKASPGRVIYLGDVNFEFGPEQITISYKNNMDAAKEYIDNHYKNLKGRLEFQKGDLLTTTNSTKPGRPGILIIPVYI